MHFSHSVTPSVIDTAGAAAHLGLSARTLEKWRTQGRGPRYSRTGRRVVYRVADLDAYLEATAVGSDRIDEAVREVVARAPRLTPKQVATINDALAASATREGDVA